MAWAVFHDEFRWDRPKSAVSFWIKPKAEPQCYPRDVIDAAIAAGKAAEHRSPTAIQKRTLKARRAK
ncbi:hypothetical protein [Sinorhizobium meliloti]|uniref:hypothetical protein n=1 Tax=Rhizobium meliloti TaxID=382 RepID=UPI0012A90EC5|nr:hypothetical protein [Sinorhizobium meliloti]QGJ74179.1 hypothetical protein C3L21_09260 [Sinorhizobium meliloti]